MANEIGIKELRDSLSRRVHEVYETGQQLIITDRGKPIVKVIPMEPWDERLARLIAEGKVTPAVGPRRRPVTRPTIKLTPGPTAAEVVVQMRDREPG